MNNPYYIEWIDAYQDSESGWRTSEQIDEWIKKWGDFIIKECGWIVKETENCIVIASEFHPENDDNAEPQYSLIQKIPKTWIKVKKEIKI